MRNSTQSKYLHAIPKRTNAMPRINITFRKAMVPGGTDNYYRYNVGDGPVLRWDPRKQDMVEWRP